MPKNSSHGSNQKRPHSNQKSSNQKRINSRNKQMGNSNKNGDRNKIGRDIDVNSSREKKVRSAQKHPKYEPQSMNRKRNTNHNITPQKIRKRNIGPYGHLLPMFVFFMVGFYLIGQLIGMSRYNEKIGVETIVIGTLDFLEEYKGIAVREEHVAISPRVGQVEYYYSEGEHVPKDAVVAVIKDVDVATPLEEKLLEIDHDILENQKNRTDLSAFAEDIARIDSSIQKIMNDNVSSFMSTSMSSAYDVKSRVATSMTKRNEIWFAESTESMSQLTEEKFQYEQLLASNTDALSANRSGLLSFHYDGLEEILTPETIDTITKAQFGEEIYVDDVVRGQIMSEGDVAFKMVTSHEWNIITYLPNVEIVDWTKGQKKDITLKYKEKNLQISTTIEDIVVENEMSKVVFSTNEYVELFMDERILGVYINSHIVQGLKVPKTAIVEKSLLAVPRTATVEQDYSTGVIMKNNDNGKFVPISIVTSDSEFYYIEQSAVLGLGDIIFDVEESEAVEYKLSTIQATMGLYLANSSIAKFTVIDILDENKEYAIVKAGSYGLQAYDLIISDAKNIQDGQIL